MVEGESCKDDGSYSTAPTAVPSFVDTGASSKGETFLTAFVERLNKAAKNNQSDHVDAMARTLRCMNLHLPENSDLRECVSRTPIVQYLVVAINAFKDPIVGQMETCNMAITALGPLLSGNHRLNIAEAYKHGALEALSDCAKMRNNRQGHVLPSAQFALALLKVDEQSDQNMFGPSSILTVVQTMMLAQENGAMQEWGCSHLNYIACGREENKEPTSGNVAKGQIFVNAISAVTAALNRHKKHPGVNREASRFLYNLAKECPSIREHMKEQGLVKVLGDSIVKWKYVNNDPDVHNIAEQALMTILAKVE